MVIGHSPLGAALVAFALLGGPGVGTSTGAEGAGGAGRVVYLFRDSLWSADPDGTRPRPLTKGMAVYAYDVTADGQRVAFAAGTWRAERKRRELIASEIWVVNADGTGLRQVLSSSKARTGHPHVGQLRWSPDGQSLAFDLVEDRGSGPGGGTLYVVRLSEGTVRRAAPEPVTSFAWTAMGEITYRAVGKSPPQTAMSPPSPPVTTIVAPPLPPGAAPQPQHPSATTSAPVPPAAPPVPRSPQPASVPRGFGAGAD